MGLIETKRDADPRNVWAHYGVRLWEYDYQDTRYGIKIYGYRALVNYEGAEANIDSSEPASIEQDIACVVEHLLGS